MNECSRCKDATSHIQQAQILYEDVFLCDKCIMALRSFLNNWKMEGEPK